MSIFRRRTQSQAKHFVVANFEAYQDRVLAEADKAFYRQHLAACQECQDWESRQLRLVEQLEIELSPPYRISPAAAERIHQDLYRRMRRANLMNNIRTSVGAVAAIAVIAVVVGVFIWWQSGNIGTTGQTTALKQESTSEETDGLELADPENLEPNITDDESVEPIATEQAALDLEGLSQAELDEYLIESVRSDDLGAIEQLLEAGADSSARTSDGRIERPILTLAAYKNNLDMVRLLVEGGADVNVLTESGPRYGEAAGSTLTAAVTYGSLEMVELLLDAGADVNASTWAESGEASEALFAAAEVNNAEITEFLLTHGAVVDGTDPSGQSPLIHAAYFNSPDVIRVLLAHGANIDLQDVSGLTALHWAYRDDNPEAAQVLIENGAAQDIESNMGQTPMEMNTGESVGK